MCLKKPCAYRRPCQGLHIITPIVCLKKKKKGGPTCFNIFEIALLFYQFTPQKLGMKINALHKTKNSTNEGFFVLSSFYYINCIGFQTIY